MVLKVVTVVFLLELIYVCGSAVMCPIVFLEASPNILPYLHSLRFPVSLSFVA